MTHTCSSLSSGLLCTLAFRFLSSFLFTSPSLKCSFRIIWKFLSRSSCTRKPRSWCWRREWLSWSLEGCPGRVPESRLWLQSFWSGRSWRSERRRPERLWIQTDLHLNPPRKTRHSFFYFIIYLAPASVCAPGPVGSWPAGRRYWRQSRSPPAPGPRDWPSLSDGMTARHLSGSESRQKRAARLLDISNSWLN